MSRDIDNIISLLAEKGCSEFTIGVEDGNETAKHIYSKLGFTQLIGRISEEYQGDSYEYGLYLKAGNPLSSCGSDIMQN